MGAGNRDSRFHWFISSAEHTASTDNWPSFYLSAAAQMRNFLANPKSPRRIRMFLKVKSKCTRCILTWEYSFKETVTLPIEGIYTAPSPTCLYLASLLWTPNSMYVQWQSLHRVHDMNSYNMTVLGSRDWLLKPKYCILGHNHITRYFAVAVT